MNIKELQERYPLTFETAYRTWIDQISLDYNWYDSTIENAVCEAELRGFVIGQRKNSKVCSFYFSGFWSQGDGASWEGHVDVPAWLEWTKEHGGVPFTEQQMLWIDAAYANDVIERTMEVVVRGNGCHSGCMYAHHVFIDTSMHREIEVGVFKGMHKEIFAGMFDSVVGDELSEVVLKAAKNFADEIYEQLENEHDYLTSEEYFIETMIIEEQDFDEDGNQVTA